MFSLKNKFKYSVLLGICCIAFQSAATAQSTNSNKQFWNDVLNDRQTAVQQQLRAGLDPNIKSTEGEPAVMWANQNGSWGVYDLFAQSPDFDPNVTNENNETPLMYLAILGELERAQDLYAKGAKINRLGWTPLHYAASKGQVEFAQWLLNEGAFVHAPAPDGTTTLMMAALSGSRQMVDLLLTAGADLKAVNINYHTAVDWAESANHSGLARYLNELQDAPQGQAQREHEAAKTESKTDAPKTSSGSSKYFDLDRFD